MFVLIKQINKFNGILKNVPSPLSCGIQLLHQPRIQNPQIQNDKEYLVRLQSDPDVFGPSPKIEHLTKHEAKEEDHLTNARRNTRQLSTKQYADIIKGLISKKKIKEAIDVVEVRMIKEDKVKPENYIYNLLLGACGRVGYTKKAFQLYNDMKKCGLVIHPGAYTALFNACANSPWPEDGLQRTKHLHNIIVETQYEPNDSNYNAMIKAYGRCGDMITAFSLVDEMFRKKFPIKDDTLNFLLQACISDKEAGFRHALLIWRKFLKKRIQPSIYSYNLLLRATRDCGLGDLNATKEVLKQILPKADKFIQIESKPDLLQIDPEENPHTKQEIQGGQLSVDAMIENRPNLLAPVPYLGDVLLLSEITKAEDRLILLGGAKNLLQDMASKNVTPDIKTFTQLLDCLPNSLTAENELLLAMKQHKVNPDLDFYNMLIKKRSMRFDYENAKDVLKQINKANYVPNLITYGILALGCKTKQEGEDFLEEMNSARYRINTEILGAMLQQSTYHIDFPYVIFVMDTCVEENIQPNEIFMFHLNKFYRKCKKISNDYSSSSIGTTKRFQKGFQIFKMRLKSWLQQVTPEESVHPWQQYRQNVETHVNHYTDVDKGSRFKPRHTSQFRVKTVTSSPIKKPKKTGKHNWKHSKQVE